MTNTIYEQVKGYVSEMFESNKRPNLIFHSLDHTVDTVKRAKEIATHYNLEERESLAVYIAAWFHDTGYLFTVPEDHEEKSVGLMEAFMSVHLPDEELIKTVKSCILATKLSNEPVTLPEQILCDADTYHLGTKDFKKTNKQVRKEVEENNKKSLTKADWNIQTLEFLENHKYYTSYCQDLLTKGKEENLRKLREKILENSTPRAEHKLFEEGPKEETSAAKEKGRLLQRGIQTVMRLASENHLRLSDMADGKANILISVNAIIISVIISVLIRKFETDPYLVIPTIIFLAFSLTTIVLAILATRPKVTKGSFSKEDIMNKKANLLFFGNFYKSPLKDYIWGMTMMMRDPDYLYGSLIKDVYYLGVVLGKKYKLLHLAYNVFMIGIIISVIAFTIAVFTRGDATSSSVISNPSTSPL